MAELASFVIEMSPAAEDPEFSASFEVEIDSFSAATASNEAIIEMEPLPNVSAGLGLSPPADAGAGIPTARPQQAWIAVRYNGGAWHRIAEMATDDGPPSVQMALAGIAWTFAFPSRVGDNGKPWTLWESDLQGLAPPGALDIDVIVEYDFGGTLVEIPLLTGGRSWASSRALLGNPLEITGKGRLSRWVRPPITYLAKVNHLKTHGQIAGELLALTGLTAAQINIDTSVGEPLIKRLEVDCDGAPPNAAKVLESYGYRLIEARTGEMLAKHAAPVHFEPVATIRADQVDIEVDIIAETDWEDVPACLVIEGDRPEIPDLSDALVTGPWKTESEIEDTVTLPVAKWSQGVGGTFTAVTGPGETSQTLVTEKIEVRETTFLGCPVTRERRVWQWFNPETWRYQTAGGSGTLTGLPYSQYNTGALSFEDTIPTKDDSSLVFQWVHSRFVIVSYEREDFFRDGELGLTGGLPDVSKPIGTTGRLALTTKGVGAWRMQEAALRFATSGAPAAWDAVNVIPNILLRGNGQPVEGEERFYAGPQLPNSGIHVEQFLTSPDFLEGQGYANVWAEFFSTAISLVDVETPTSEDRPGGWETGRVETQSGWERPDGGLFQYLDAFTSSDGSVQGRVTLTTRNSFIAEGGGTHTRITSPVDGEGRPLPTLTERGQAGHLPNADVCGEEAALEENTVTVRGQACLPEGLFPTAAEKWTDTLRFDFGVETAAQADRLAEIELRRRAAASVSVTMPLNALLSVLDPLRLDATDLGINPDAIAAFKSNAWIEDIEHQDERDPESGAVKRTTSLTLAWAIV